MEALRQILAVFTVDNTSLKKGVIEGSKLVDQLKDGLAALAGPLVAAFSGAAVVGFARDLIESADAASKMADSLGLGIVELQGWEHAADMSGVAGEQLAMVFGKLQLGLSEIASKGTGPAAEAFKALGIEAKTSEGKLKSSSAVLEEVADAIQGMDADKRNAALMKLFGEQGAKLVPLLKGGSAGVRALRKEVEELGFAFDDQFAAGAEEFNDNMTRLTKAGQGFLLQVLGPIMPELVDLSEQLVKGAKAAIPMVKQLIVMAKNSRLLETAVALLAGKALVHGIANFGKLATALKLATSAALRFILPLVAIQDLMVFLAGGDSVIGRRLNEWFGDGTADKARATINALTSEVMAFVSEVKDRAIPILQEWGPHLVKFGAVVAAAVVGVKLFTGVMAAWAVGVKLATGAMALFNAVMALNPAVLVGAAIVAALGLIVAFWPEISGFFSDLWDKVKQVGSDIADWFGAVWDRVVSAFQTFIDRTKAGADWLLTGVKLVWTELQFAGLRAAAALSDGFGTAWNTILEGAKRVMGVYADLASYIPGIGDQAADGIRQLASKLDGLTANVDATQIVNGQYEDARQALVADLELAASRMQAPASRTNQDSSAPTQQPKALPAPIPQYYTAPAPTNVTNVTQDVSNKTDVHVTVPPGTDATVADRVGKAAARGAAQGSARNLRATQDALVPRPPG